MGSIGETDFDTFIEFEASLQEALVEKKKVISNWWDTIKEDNDLVCLCVPILRLQIYTLGLCKHKHAKLKPRPSVSVRARARIHTYKIYNRPPHSSPALGRQVWHPRVSN